jgi:predicted TIM-barrel enzyme
MSTIIPVIHVVNKHQLEYNIDLCHSNGINNVFLINHQHSVDAVGDLLAYSEIIRNKYPDMWIGANFLQLNIQESFVVANENSSLDSIWTDTGFTDKQNPEDILKYKGNLIHFGGVAFKYQKQPKPQDLEMICKMSTKYIDVITTSGDKTGHPPTVDKIKTIRSYIGDHPLAIASGITPENKSMYTDYVDYMLVASSITDPMTEMIIESKLKELIK